MHDEVKDYVERAVADIARKCGCSQTDVWKRMYVMSKQENAIIPD